MKKAIREYWLLLGVSLSIIIIGTLITIAQGIKVGFFAYGVALVTLLPIFLDIYDKVTMKRDNED